MIFSNDISVEQKEGAVVVTLAHPDRPERRGDGSPGKKLSYLELSGDAAQRLHMLLGEAMTGV